MKKKLKSKYQAGGPPQNFYFGQPRDNGMARYNANAMAQSAGVAVAALNAGQEEKQKNDLINAGQSLLSAMGKKRGGFKYKFGTGGTACPDGYLLDSATGQCMPDPDWVGATPGTGVMAEQYLPGLDAAATGEYQQSSGLTTLENYGNLNLNPYIKKSLDVGTKIASGTGVLQTNSLTDPNAVNAATSANTQDIVGNIGQQAQTAGQVTDKVEQGAAMASQGKSMFSSAPIAGGVLKAGAFMAENMTSDKNAATVTKGEKFGIGANSILSGAAAGSKYGLPGMIVGGMLGAVRIKKNLRDAELTARNIRSEEEQLGVASREASKDSWQGQQAGFGYKSSTNMGMKGLSGYYGAKTGGVRRVPGGKIVPIGKGAVKFLGNKHSEDKIDGVSGIHIDNITEVEDKERMGPVFDKTGKRIQYIWSEFLKRNGGKSYAKTYEDLIKKGASQEEIQNLAKEQEAKASKKEPDRSPDTILRYGGVRKYQTGNIKEEETKSPESWEDIERVLPVPKEVNAQYLEKVLSYCDQFPESQNCWNMPHAKTKDGETYVDVERYKQLPYVNQLVGALSSPAFRPGPNGEKIDLMKEIGSPMRLTSRSYRNDTDESTYDVSARSGNYTTKNPQGFEGMGNPGDRVEIMTPQKAAEQGAQVSMPTKEDKERQDKMKNFDKNYGPSTWIKSKNKKLGGYNTVRKYQTAGEKDEEEEKMLGPEVGAEETPTATTPRGGTSFEETQKIMDAVEAGAIPAGEYDSNVQAAQNKAAAAAAPSIDDMVEMADGSYIPKDQYEKEFLKIGKDFKASEVTGKNVPADEVRYEGGKNYLIPGRFRFLKGDPEYSTLSKVYKMASGTGTDDTNNKSPYSKIDEAYLGLEDAAKTSSAPTATSGTAAYNDLSGTKPATTPEASANAQSNANASNVTVRDQNAANAAAPNPQQSVASTSQGGTTNAGQNAANTAAAVTSTTNNTTATSTSLAGTPTTGTPGKERYFGKEDITKGNKGVSKSMEKVPANQGDQGTYFGKVSNAQFDAFKANNPWFDFAAGFDPKKRDFTSSKGIKGSSDVARFQEEYNKHVGEGNKLQVDGKLGEQTATAMLMFTDPAAITPGVTEEKPKEETKEQKVEPCAEGTFRNEAGECVPMAKNINPRSPWNPIPGITQYAAPLWAATHPYQTAAGISGATAKAGPLHRENLNQERATNREENIAATNMVRNQSGPQAAISQMFNNRQNENQLKISKQETEANKGLATAEKEIGTKVSMFNAGQEQERQKFNKQAEIDEKRYKREDTLGYMQQIGLVTAGNYKDKMQYEATERLANALDETGSYTRLTLMEALRKDPSFKGMSDKQLKEFANAYYNGRERAGEKTNVGGSEKNANTQKFGGARKYTSRLGELTKRKSLNFSK